MYNSVTGAYCQSCLTPVSNLELQLPAIYALARHVLVIGSMGISHCSVFTGDMYDTDMDDKMGLTRSPAKHPLQDAGLDIQATQAGVSHTLSCGFLVALPHASSSDRPPCCMHHSCGKPFLILPTAVGAPPAAVKSCCNAWCKHHT